MKKNLIMVLSLVFMFGFIISCDDDDKDNGNGGGNYTITNPLGAEFNGNFTSGCKPDDEGSEIENVDIENSVITVTEIDFSGTDCAEGNIKMKQVHKLAYNVTGDYKGATIIQAIDGSRTEAQTFYVKVDVDSNNASGYMARNDWEVGVEKDITAFLKSMKTGSDPEDHYEIIKVVGDTLYVNDYSPEDGDENEAVDSNDGDQYYRVGSR